MARVVWRNKVFDTQTVAMLQEAERISGIRIVPTQGSYNTSIGASAGTHSGPGAFDASVRGLTRTQQDRLTSALRKVGFASWLRLPADGLSPHIHGIANGMSGLPGVAYRQTVSYKNKRNGLANNGPDRQAYLGVPYRTWADYKRLKAAAVSRPANAINMSAVRYGRNNSQVKKFHAYLRAYLWKQNVSVNKINPSGVSGYYGYELARLVSTANHIFAKNSPGWADASTRAPGSSFAKRIGLAPY